MVYILRAANTDKWKVGYTASDCHSRIRHLQTASPERIDLYRTLDGDMTTERKIHNRLRPFRLSGGKEWFHVTEDELNMVLSTIDTPLPGANSLIEDRIIKARKEIITSLGLLHSDQIKRQQEEIDWLRSQLMHFISRGELRQLQEAAGLLPHKTAQSSPGWLSGLTKWARCAIL